MTTDHRNTKTFRLVKKNGGFTLVETLVTLAVLLAALTGPVVLITQGLSTFSFAKNKLAALNLAQEGLELIRVIRENNVICDILNATSSAIAWGADPADLGGANLGGTFALALNDTVARNCKPPGTGPDIMITTPRPIAAVNCNTQQLRMDGIGIHSYVGGTVTKFSRCITVCTPPASAPCTETDDTDLISQDQMEVISRVSWEERGLTQNVELQERLYNWR